MSLNGRLSGQVGGGGGGENFDTSFVYQPGGTPGGNNYDDWTLLNTALNERAGRREIVFDNQFQGIVIPTGDWDMPDVAWYGTNVTEDTTRVSITFADGARVPRLRELHNLRLHASNSSPFDDFQDNDRIAFYNCELAGADGNFTPIMDLGSMPPFKSMRVELREGSSITGNGYGFAALVYDNQTLNIDADLDSTVGSNTLAAESDGTIVLKNAGSGAVSPQQSNNAGTLTYLDQVRAFPHVVYQNGAVIRPGYVTLIDITGGPVSVTLPAANDPSVVNGGLVILKIATEGTDAVTITADGGSLIDGQASWTLPPPYGVLMLVPTSVGWMTLNRPSGSTFVEREPVELLLNEIGHGALPGFQPASMVTLDEDFSVTSLTRFTIQSENSHPVTPVISSNHITFTGTSGAPSDWNTLIYENSGLPSFGLTVPQFAVSMHIDSASSTAGNAYENIGVGVMKNNLNFILAVWERVDAKIAIQVNIGGSGGFHGAVSFSAPSSFYLGLSMVSNTLTAWTSTDAVTWTPRTTYEMSSDLDMRSDVLTNGPAWKPGITVAHPATQTFTLVVSALKCGSYGTVGVRDIVPVTNLDGTVPLTSNAFDFTATFMDPQGAAYCAGGRYNLVSRTMTMTSVIFVDRSSKIYNDSAAHLVKDGSSGFHAFITSWGNAGGAAVDIQIQYKHETTLDLLNGVSRPGSFSTLSLPNVPGDGGAYDPNAIFDGSTWYLAYTVGPNSISAYYPALATTTDLSTYTAVAADTGAVPYEGTRIVRMSDQYWVIASSLAHYRVYDLSMAFQGTFTCPLHPESGTFFPPHPTLVPLGNYVYNITFDNTELASVVGTEGRFRVFRAERYTGGPT